MSEAIRNIHKTFDMSLKQALEMKSQSDAIKMAKMVIDLSRTTIDFAKVERVPRYSPTRRENDAEHSYMLGLVATEIAASYFDWLDVGLVSQFSNVHDLAEVFTKDVPTFLLDEAGFIAKELAEKEATEQLVKILPRYTGKLLLRYEVQKEPEARFVRHVDKLLPYAVDIISGTGKQVMAEDYNIHTSQQMLTSNERIETRFHLKFPEPSHEPLHRVHTILADRLAMEYDK